MDEITQAKFDEKLKELLNVAKKKKNVLEAGFVNDYFKELPLEEEHFEKIMQTLEENGIIQMSGEDTDIPDDEVNITEEDEVDVENIDLSVPDGISIEDPVRMYLKEIGKVPLLTAEEEIDYAQKMENGVAAEEQLAELEERLAEASGEEKEALEKEKKELGYIIMDGEDAKKKLAEANLRLVVSIAKRYVGRGMLFLDLIQEGISV